MPSRRDQITLTEAEQGELLDSERVVIVSSIGPRAGALTWRPEAGGQIW